MARKRDIAGLAALAGLGMLMANKGGGGKGVKADRDVSDREDARMPEAPGRELDDDMFSDFGSKKGRGAAGTSETMSPKQFGEPGTSMTVSPSRTGGGGGGGAAPAAPAAKPQAAPVPRLIDRTPPVGTGSGGGRGPKAGEVEAYRQKQYEAAQAAAATPEGKAARQKQAESQAVEGVYPESNLVAPGLKTMHGIAKGLAAKFGSKEAPAAASPFLKELPAPTKQLPYDKAGAVNRAREARAAGRNEEMARENARRYGLNPDDMSATTSSLLRKNMGGDDFSLPLKKGGKVRGYASGGSVSSASRRGDGIATKGKTRGKMC